MIKRSTEIGIHPLLLSWLCSYISERKQHVLVNGEHSKSTRVLSGVSQGSVLGPILFLIYIDSIIKVPLSQYTKFILYTDGMLLYKPIFTQSHDILNYNRILTGNIFHPTMPLNNQPLEKVQQYKYLGVILSYNLCWSHYVQVICRRARKVLFIIYRKFSSNITDCSVIFRLYIALVQPHLEYLEPSPGKGYPLEKLQKCALRICVLNPMKLYWISSNIYHNRIGCYFYNCALLNL